MNLVFTLPHDLNRLVGQDPRAIYETLFGAVSATLTAFAANPRWLGGTPAFSLVLHTWKQDLARLYAHEWVVYAKQPLGGPAQVLEYLSRYTHRVAISNERIVGMDDREVRFRVRDSAHGNRRRTLALPADTFIDRFLLHVLPKGFKRIRHYGLLGPAGKAVKLAQARAALSVPAPDPLVVESVAAFMRRIDRGEWSRCPHCTRGHFMFVQALPPQRRWQPLRGPP